MVLVFGSLYVVNYVYRLVYVEPALHPQDEAYLIMVDKLFNVLLDLVCQYFIEDFCICVYHGYWSEVFFSFSFLKERKKWSEGEEERGRKRGRENGNVALF